MPSESDAGTRARCIEDYRYVGQDTGGSVYTFCDRCPRVTPPGGADA